MSELPKGWNVQKFDSIADIVRGVTYKKADSADFQQDGFMPLYRANNIQSGSLIESDLVYIPETLVKAAQVIQSGDIVVAMSSGSKSVVGKSAQWFKDHKVTFGAFCGVLRPNSVLDSKYVGYFTQTRYYRELLSSLSAGANINNLKPAYFGELDFPLAPLAEQKRIVEKLDEVLAQVDTIKARLDGIPALLKRFRQSVLASAVSGKLTEEWRGSANSFDEWKILSIGDISTVATGKTPKRTNSEYWNSEDVPWLTSSATGDLFCYEAEQFVSSFGARDCKLKRFPIGTLLLAMYGEGKTRGQVTELMLEATCNQACAAIIVDENKALKSYVKLRLLENYEETRKAAAGGNQPNLNLNKVREISIRLPPKEEQKEIVRLVDQYFAFADTIEVQVKKAQARVDNLTQSILAKAFRGELVEQDPNDEPADKLLERIAQARKEAEALAKAAKKAQSTKSTVKKKVAKSA
ncbi:restriction endonuclease subunit S [Vibrio parahaemolyticus]|nr:restriction endonuclease subunit S [Vibrio parahaemolyticus]MDF4275980.1 restriction endonuclease subunit S [Vibrio parahaemolyticus]MDF5050994.1 restriction endonuclease subunit S [Vibrio parahaemolyticus]MDF5110291.1 restriction endonuclease subunit S [Vibrio parahaemolyticus]MDF5125321.1 restriction endonuclease subunit S [Vibrio parahaemolyticus]